jgi:hypothetical protein
MYTRRHQIKIGSKRMYYSIKKGKDAWLCIDIAAGDLMTHVDLAIKNGLKRVVFGINLSGSETEASDLVFTKETELLAKSGIQYTILKYSR